MSQFERVTRLNSAIDSLVKSGKVATQKDIADKMSMQRTTINAAVNGKYGNPTDSFLKKFAWTFGFNADYLINGNGSLTDVDPADAVLQKTDDIVINSVSEHDALIKTNTQIDGIKAIVGTVDDADLAIELISKILGVQR